MDKQDILKRCYVEGNIVKLPDIQLDRNLYIEVKTALELIGGKWKGGKTQGFVFKEDPTSYLEKLCSGEKINLKKEFQFFATPDTLADRLVELAEIQDGNVVLEPSAGQGAIIKAVHRAHPKIEVDCFELMDLNRTFLEKLPNTTIVGHDFIKDEKTFIYDRIIANPPFSKNQDIEHVSEMYKYLKDGGRLVSVMSNHWRFASGKKEKTFQRFIEDTKATIYDIEPGTFKESGTNVAACIVVIDRHNPDEVTKLLDGLSSRKSNSQPNKIIPSASESKNAEKEFSEMFNRFIYAHGHSEVFIDFLDYCLLAFQWWKPNRDFSFWENRYQDLYPNFLKMFELLGIASDNGGEGFHDALGDLFMDLVSHGRNGQFFTPENICEMMTQMTGTGNLKDGQAVLDPACGSARMLLAAGRINRKAFFCGCDNDITCCKMAALNLLLNTMQGEIALMDSLKMDFIKSWRCDFHIINGVNYPVFRVIEKKEESTLWQLHMNSFSRDDCKEDTEPETTVVSPLLSSNNTPTQKRKVKKGFENQLEIAF